MAPLQGPIKCNQCKCTEAMLWKSIGENQHLCNDCFERTKSITVKNEQELPSKQHALIRTDERKVKLRKSTRSTRYSGKNGNGTSNATAVAGPNTLPGKSGITKPSGRGRRNLFRRPPAKAPVVTATTQYVKSLFYKGSYIQIGDIVSLCNSKYDIFYAQIRGLMVDSFCEKSAVLTWLLPTQSSPSPRESFDPSTYIIGPDEDQPRLLSSMEFVMHAPSDYYHDKTTPYPPTDCNVLGTTQSTTGGFLWTNIEAK